MLKRTFARRYVVYRMAAAGVMGLPMAHLLSASALRATATFSYDPNAQFAVNEIWSFDATMLTHAELMPRPKAVG